MPKVTVSCAACSDTFYVWPSRLASGRAMCCSRKCVAEFNRRRERAPFSQTHRARLSDAAKKRVGPRGSSNPRWKGDAAAYKTIHNWVSKRFGRPQSCECCGTTDAAKYDWANVSGKYLRERGDWIRLCRKCHNTYDREQRCSLFYELNGVRHSLKELSDMSGIPYDRLYDRVRKRGIEIERAINPLVGVTWAQM